MNVCKVKEPQTALNPALANNKLKVTNQKNEESNPLGVKPIPSKGDLSKLREKARQKLKRAKKTRNFRSYMATRDELRRAEKLRLAINNPLEDTRSSKSRGIGALKPSVERASNFVERKTDSFANIRERTHKRMGLEEGGGNSVPLALDRSPSPRRKRFSSSPVHGRFEWHRDFSRSRSPESTRSYRGDTHKHLSAIPQNVVSANLLEMNEGQFSSWEPTSSSHIYGRREKGMAVPRSQSSDTGIIQQDDKAPQWWRSQLQRQFINEPRHLINSSRSSSPGRQTVDERSYGNHSQSAKVWPDSFPSRFRIGQMVDPRRSPSFERSTETQPSHGEETSHRFRDNISSGPLSHGSNQSSDQQSLNNAEPEICTELVGAKSLQYGVRNVPVMPPHFSSEPTSAVMSLASEDGLVVNQGWQPGTLPEGIFPDPIFPYNANFNAPFLGVPLPFPNWTGIGPDQLVAHPPPFPLPFPPLSVIGNKDASSIFLETYVKEFNKGIAELSGTIPDENAALNGSSVNNETIRREAIVLCAQDHPHKKISQVLCNEVSTNVCVAAFFNSQVRIYKNVRQLGRVMWWCADDFTEDWVARQVAAENCLTNCPYKIVRFSEFNEAGRILPEASSNDDSSIVADESIQSEPIVLCSKSHPEQMLPNSLTSQITATLMKKAHKNDEINFRTTSYHTGLVIWWCRCLFTIDWIVKQVALILKQRPYKILKWCEVKGIVKDLSKENLLDNSDYCLTLNTQSSIKQDLPSLSSQTHFPGDRESKKKEMRIDPNEVKERQPTALCSKVHPESKLSETVCSEIRRGIGGAALTNPKVRIYKSYQMPGMTVWCCADEYTEEWITKQVASLECVKGCSYKIEKLCQDQKKGDNGKVKVVVPLCTGVKTTGDVMTAFKVQCGFPVEKWEVLDVKMLNDSFSFIFKVEKDTLKMLKEVQMCPFFGDRRIKFVSIH